MARAARPSRSAPARGAARAHRGALPAAAVVVAAAVVAGAVLLTRSGDRPGVVASGSPSPVACTTPGPATVGRDQFPSEPCMTVDRNALYEVTMETSHGTIRAILDPKLAPRTVNSFVFLARQGFYDGTTFYRVQNVKDPDPRKDFAIVQGGDPTNTGAGGPGYSFGEPPPPITKYLRGNLVMARKRAPNTNGSQFFIVVRDWEELPPHYTFFGVVADERSMTVLDEMVESPGTPLPGNIGIAPDPPIRLHRVIVAENARS